MCVWSDKTKIIVKVLASLRSEEIVLLTLQKLNIISQILLQLFWVTAIEFYLFN